MNEGLEVSVPNTIVRAGQGKRYRFVVERGREIFKNSGVVDNTLPITKDDAARVHRFHEIVSPRNWKKKGTKPNQITDPSTFDNWEEPGGPLEHMNLAMQAAPILLKEVLRNIGPEDEVDDARLREVIQRLKKANPNLLAVAAGLHDEGRELTHIFLRTDLVGGSLLNKIGAIKEITQILPDERLMLTPKDRDMDEEVLNMSPEAVLIRIADDFGKRMGGTNRLMQPSDISMETQEAWAKRYRLRPPSGAASDEWMRKRFYLHNANAARYASALSSWLVKVTGKPLEHYTKLLNSALSPSLPPLPEAALREKVLLGSDELKDGEAVQKEIVAGESRIEIKAVTQKGGLNKKFNEDGGVILSDYNSVSVVVVDGGTQIEQVPSLGDLSGGVYIRQKVEEYARIQSPNDSPERLLQSLNSMIVGDMRANHPEITFQEDSRNIPYGCIAAVKVDTKNNTVEIANAGDVSIVIIDKSGTPQLVSYDSVYEYDQRSFARAEALAKEHGATTREALGHAMRKTDARFSPVLDQMLETMKASNSGEIERIMGLDKFRVHQAEFPLESISSIFVFTDGVPPAGIDVHIPEGLREFTSLIKSGGFADLLEERKKRAAADPDFEKSPRFRDLDDMFLVELSLQKI